MGTYINDPGSATSGGGRDPVALQARTLEELDDDTIMLTVILRHDQSKTLFIEPRSPWENGYNESFNGKIRDELLNGEIFYTLKEAQVLIEAWRQHYNTIRPHSALGYRPPAPENRTSGRPDPAFAIDGLRPDRAFPVGAALT